MPFSTGPLKFRKNRRRHGIFAHRVVVKRHLPWYWILLGVALALALVVAILWLLLPRDESSGAERELDSLRHQVRQLDGELLGLRSSAGTEQNAVQMERATSQQLIGRVKALEAENAALKEDLLLFERLVQASGGESAIRVEGLKVVPDGGQHYRYRILLAFQPGKRSPEFRGQLQLSVVFLAEGGAREMLVPNVKEGLGGLQLKVRGFLRKEGRFELPAGAVLQSVEARIFQGDTLKTKRQVQL